MWQLTLSKDVLENMVGNMPIEIKGCARKHDEETGIGSLKKVWSTMCL